MDDFRHLIDLDQLTSAGTLTLARAAEAIRGLNWTTSTHAGLDQPSVAYDLAASLSLAASRLPQLLTQITRYLGSALAAGQLGHDLGEDPAHDIRAAAVSLHHARLSAAALATSLNQAQQQLARINGTPARSRPQHT